LKIQIILGSTRPGRNGEQVAKWVHENLSKTDIADFELVDVADYKLPLLDEPQSPKANQYTKDHTKRWSEKIAEADGYIFVTAEYNHGVPAAFKNAVDFLYHEWTNKAVGFVGYGSIGGARAIEHWRGISGELQLADVNQTVMFSLFNDFENFSTLKPQDNHREQLELMANQVVAWSKALKPVRETALQSA
jgi:NAD(P)H-dependent FMN reductase